jgi:iron complex outermembrane receptor protein
MTTFGKIALAGVSLISLSTAAPAFAAEGDEAEVENVIIVEARRKDERLEDVPLTVNAVTSEDLQKLNIRDMKDITGVVPGLVLNPGNRTTGAVSSLRGLSVDVNSSGANGSVEFYLNDAPTPAGGVLQSMFDVGQIEVLRGPQGTLRGRASPSGSITVTTRKADMDNWGGFVQGTVNDIGTVNLQAALNAPVIPGILAVRLAGLVDRNEGNRVSSLTNSTLEPSNKTNAGRISLRATPLDGLELNFTYTRMVRNSIIWDQMESANLATGTALAAGSTLVTARDRKAVSNVPNDNHMGFKIFNWQAQYSFLGQRLNYVGSTFKQNLYSTEPGDKGNYFDSTWPGDGSLPNNNRSYATLASGLNVQNVAQASHSYSNYYNHEVRLSSEERIFGMFDYVIGGFKQKGRPFTDLVNAASVNVNPATKTLLSLTPQVINRRGYTRETSFFGNLTLHLGEKTEFSGGARHIKYTTNTNYANVADPDPARKDKFNTWIWSASAKHRFSDDLMVYANAGSSWRVGSGTNALILSRSINPANIKDPYLASLIAFTPEKSKSYEIGIRSNWLDRKVTLNISAFKQDFQGYIFPISPFYIRDYNPTTSTYGTPVLTISTIAAPVPAKVKGIEAEISARPAEGLNLGATIAYAKAKMSNATVPCAPPTQPGATEQVAQCTRSQSAGRMSPFSASLQGEYTHALNDGMNGFVRMLMPIYGNSTNDPANPYDDVKSYSLTNVYLGVRAEDGSWEVSGYVKNLFNTFRVTDRAATAANIRVNGVTTFSNYRAISSTDPRELGLTARFAFGSR